MSEVKEYCTAEDFSGANTYIRQILLSVDGPRPLQIFGPSTDSDIVQILEEILPKLYSKSLMVLAKDEAWLINSLMLFTVGPPDVHHGKEEFDRWRNIMDQCLSSLPLKPFVFCLWLFTMSFESPYHGSTHSAIVQPALRRRKTRAVYWHWHVFRLRTRTWSVLRTSRVGRFIFKVVE